MKIAYENLTHHQVKKELKRRGSKWNPIRSRRLKRYSDGDLKQIDAYHGHLDKGVNLSLHHGHNPAGFKGRENYNLHSHSWTASEKKSLMHPKVPHRLGKLSLSTNKEELRDKGLSKKADIALRKGRGKGDPKLTSIGWFVGHEKEDGNHDDTEKKMVSYLKKHKSMRKARAAYEKDHPGHFTTMAYVHEHEPRKPLLFGRKKYKKSLKSYNERSAKPAVHIHAGRAGSSDQTSFYNHVAAGHLPHPQRKM